MGIPVFPISIRQDRSGKWDKVPLIRNWVEEAGDPDEFDWDMANGVGLRMGDGWYALDVDAHKPGAREAAVAWVEAHDVPRKTRQHITVSGGHHLIYRLPQGWEHLRTRANVVHGLDTRGQGGFIAFGPGYRVVTGYDVEPVLLPEKACIALDAETTSGMLVMGALEAVGADQVRVKLAAALAVRTSALARRWAGITSGMVDGSRSALDMAVARLLALHGFTEGEIVTALLEIYPFGQARHLEGWRGLRAARRCAARAILEAWRVDPPETDEDSPEIEAVMVRLMQRQSRRNGE
jgi:hypothetical protein